MCQKIKLPDLETLRKMEALRGQASPALAWSNSQGFVGKDRQTVHQLETRAGGNALRKKDGKLMAFLFANAEYLLGLAIQAAELAKSEAFTVQVGIRLRDPQCLEPLGSASSVQLFTVVVHGEVTEGSVQKALVDHLESQFMERGYPDIPVAEWVESKAIFIESYTYSRLS